MAWEGREAMHTRSFATARRAIFGAGAFACSALACATASLAFEGVRVTDLMTKPLVGVPGKEVTMITVDYAPGAADPVHRHDASAFVYVLEGAVEMQMAGGEKVTLGPGQTFYEDPNGVHLVGRNASETEPAKFVVVLVKNEAAPILVPVEP